MSRTRDRRKSWTGSRRFDYSCRNHGQCSWCRRNRTISTKKVTIKARDEVESLRKDE